MTTTRKLVEFLKRYRAPSDISKYLSSHAERKLNIGCGGNILRGWLNVDFEPSPGAVYLDARNDWPLAAGAFDAALSEHMIEHISKADGAEMLAKIFRVLKPGGVVRVVTPDLAFIAELITSDSEDGRRYLATIGSLQGSALTKCDAVNLLFRGYGHVYLYSASELSDAARRAGFVDIVETRAGQPLDPIFSRAEGHGGVIGEDINALEAFAIEARKPLTQGAA
jgi:predicted SAM-dependent methyltransferase